MTEAEWIAFLQRPELPAFNRAMLERPEDDLPRLVFADWMDEHCPDAEVNQAVRASIAGRHRGASWPGLAGNARWNLSFTRGRVAAWVNLNTHPPEQPVPPSLLEAVWRADWVEVLRFGRMRLDFIQGWLSAPPMRLVCEIELDGNGLSVTALGRWLASERLAALTALTVYGPCHDPGWVRGLADTPSIARLTGLTFDACRVGDEGAFALAACPHLTRLTRLDLRGNEITAAGAAALARSPHLCEAIRARWRRPGPTV